jgi:FkbM family methyltransferase
MSFISYAQNFEDVMLWRALKHVQKGFYIDVGAAWPDEHSVTKAFYLSGWRGINIEPNPKFHQLLKHQRPEDLNLKIAVGDHEGSVMMSIINDTGLSTVSAAIAGVHKDSGWQLEVEEVALTTLASISQQNVKQGQDIHFLKVDVEGLEEAALRGNDWTTYRPWIVLVEATLPMTQIESFQEWEPILINGGYAFAYADGLNRFYVANEHAELLDSFKYPPNVFDSFLLNSQQEAEAKAQQAEAKAQQAEAKAQQAKAKVVEAQVLANSHIQTIQDQDAELAAVRQELHDVHQSNHHHWQLAEQRQQIIDALHSSKSWRITAPMRWPVHQVRLLHQHGFKSRIKGLVKKVLKKLVTQVVARPTLRAFATRLAHRLGVTDRLKPFVVGVLNPKTTTQNSVTYLGLERSQAGVYLDKRAERVFADLKNAKNGVFEK